jgi:hypothetical protein
MRQKQLQKMCACVFFRVGCKQKKGEMQSRWTPEFFFAARVIQTCIIID